MTKPLSPTDTIRFRLETSEYPVIRGQVDGDYSMDAVFAFENEVRRWPEVTRADLAKRAGYLVYLVDTREPIDEQ